MGKPLTYRTIVYLLGLAGVFGCEPSQTPQSKTGTESIENQAQDNLEEMLTAQRKADISNAAQYAQAEYAAAVEFREKGMAETEAGNASEAVRYFSLAISQFRLAEQMAISKKHQKTAIAPTPSPGTPRQSPAKEVRPSRERSTTRQAPPPLPEPARQPDQGDKKQQEIEPEPPKDLSVDEVLRQAEELLGDLDIDFDEEENADPEELRQQIKAAKAELDETAKGSDEYKYAQALEEQAEQLFFSKVYSQAAKKHAIAQATEKYQDALQLYQAAEQQDTAQQSTAQHDAAQQDDAQQNDAQQDDAQQSGGENRQEQIGALKALVEEYREAYQDRDIDLVSELRQDITDEEIDDLYQFFEQARGLKVTMTLKDEDIVFNENTATSPVAVTIKFNRVRGAGSFTWTMDFAKGEEGWLIAKIDENQ